MADKQHFHFIGICGTAMGAVAAGMKAQGFPVSGSDAQVFPPMSTFLESQGIHISHGYRAENIPAAADVIVIGNAISRGNEEAEAALERKLLYVSLPEVLKEHFLRGKRNFIVSGTHGKTTTSSMLAWLMKFAQRNPSWMIGGLPKNLGCGAYFSNSDFTVMEGDEYDTAFFDKRSKFLHYLPECVIINNIEYDHADIYQNLEEIKTTFRRLLNIVPRNGVAFINGDDKNSCDVALGAHCPIVKVGMTAENDLRIIDVCYRPDGTSFTLQGQEYDLPMVGEFNVRNAAMAISAARHAGLTAEECRAGLTEFDGVARRQELRGEVRGIKVIDDFAHHPTAIRLAVQAMRQRYKDHRLWLLFEPRSNTTKRNVFQAELASALATADISVVAALTDIHKVPEAERLDPTRLAHDIAAAGGKAWYLANVEEIVAHVAREALPGDVVAVLSNGGFGGIHQKLLTALA